MKIMKKSIIYLLLMLLLSSLVNASDYYVMVGDMRTGPNSLEQLKEMQNKGQLTESSMVWAQGMSVWEAANTQTELKSLFISIPPPPPMNAMAPPPFAPVASSNEGLGQKEINEINKMADTKSVQSASDSVDDWAANAVANFGRSVGEFGEKDGKFILYSSQAVSLKNTDPQYGDALINAYDKALIKIQEEYVMIRFGKTTVDKVKSFYSDRSTNAKNLELPKPSAPKFTNKLYSVLDKGLDVIGKKLDKELVELGEDPQKVKTMPEKVKKDLFRDKFIKNTIRKASGEISGLFVLQTVVSTDDKGKNVVGVMAIVSDKTIQIAKDIKLQRASLVEGKGKDIKSLLPTNNQDYLQVFGTRLAYDLDASPVIISYGLSSYRQDSGDDYIDDELKSEAKADAISNADAQIAELINGHMNVNNERKRGEEIKKSVEREVAPDSDTIEKTIKSIVKITNNNTKSSASAKLQGISTVKLWRHTAKTGQKFVGAVRVWKYSTLDALKQFNSTKFAKKKVQVKKAVYKESIRESKPVNSMADF